MSGVAVAWEAHKTSLLSLKETLEATGGTCLGFSQAENFCFISVATDSRNVDQKTLFVPLRGKEQDGHSYILAALDNGASVIFTDKQNFDTNKVTIDELQKKYSESVFIVVENTLQALQQLAKAYVKKFPDLIRIGITGSSGKTTTKEIVASILSQKFSVVMNEGNLNSETGLPLSVFKIRKEHQVGVFELGMNRKGEIKEIATVLNPKYAVITNIGTAHIGLLGSQEAIAYEKKQIFSLFDSESTAFILEKDAYSEYLAEGLKCKVVRYGKEAKVAKSVGLAGTNFIVDGINMHLPLPGSGNLYDCLAAIAVAKELGCNTEQIKIAVESIKPLFGRSQIIQGKLTVIQDCYNANPDSMIQALELLASLDSSLSKIAVLADMLELGENSQAAHDQIIEKALECGLKFIICIGNQICNATLKYSKTKKCKERILCFSEPSDENVAMAAEYICKNSKSKDVVLLKGSRGMKLERFTPLITGGVL